MWCWDSSWLPSGFLIKKEQNQKGYLLINGRIYLLLRQCLGKNQFIANVSCRFADFRQLTRAAIIHTKNIHCVANNSFWWIRPWLCWMLGGLWILNILSSTNSSCSPWLVWTLSRWAEPKLWGALAKPLRLERVQLCGMRLLPLKMMICILKKGAAVLAGNEKV